MGVRLLSVDGNGQTCLFDSVTGWAFGPVADEDVLSEFLKFCAETDAPDLRSLVPSQVAAYWEAFNASMRVVSEEG